MQNLTERERDLIGLTLYATAVHFQAEKMGNPQRRTVNNKSLEKLMERYIEIQVVGGMKRLCKVSLSLFFPHNNEMSVSTYS